MGNMFWCTYGSCTYLTMSRTGPAGIIGGADMTILIVLKAKVSSLHQSRVPLETTSDPLQHLFFSSYFVEPDLDVFNWCDTYETRRGTPNPL